MRRTRIDFASLLALTFALVGCDARDVTSPGSAAPSPIQDIAKAVDASAPPEELTAPPPDPDAAARTPADKPASLVFAPPPDWTPLPPLDGAGGTPIERFVLSRGEGDRADGRVQIRREAISSWAGADAAVLQWRRMTRRDPPPAAADDIRFERVPREGWTLTLVELSPTAVNARNPSPLGVAAAIVETVTDVWTIELTAGAGAYARERERFFRAVHAARVE